MRGEQRAEGEAGRECTDRLTCHEGGDVPGREPTCGPEADGDGRVEMCAGDVADGVDHRHDNESEGEGDADVGNGAAGEVIHDDSAGPREDEREGPNELSEALSGDQQSSPGVRLTTTSAEVLRITYGIWPKSGKPPPGPVILR